MEPVTHALTSLALARAGKKQLPRFGTAMLIVAGIAPDLDYASYLGGARAFLRFDRTVLHSLVSSSALAVALAGAFYVFANRRDQRPTETNVSPGPSLRFAPALIVCAIGIGAHLLLDLASGVGVQLLWPFRVRWFALDLLREFDLWILIFLAAGLLLPMLTGLVSEEIGERRNAGRGKGSAIAALALLLVYVGARELLHERVVDLLRSRDYHGRAPLAVGAFPSSTSPLEWRGVASTDNTIEEIDVSLAAGREFDTDRSVTQYKPEDSAALQAGQQTAAAQLFLKYARFPLASVVRLGDAYRFELRDERFERNDGSPANILVQIEIRDDYRIGSEQFLFASPGD